MKALSSLEPEKQEIKPASPPLQEVKNILPAPSVISIQPTVIPLTGDKISIIGTNFRPDISVIINSKKYLSFNSFLKSDANMNLKMEIMNKLL